MAVRISLRAKRKRLEFQARIVDFGYLCLFEHLSKNTPPPPLRYNRKQVFSKNLEVTPVIMG